MKIFIVLMLVMAAVLAQEQQSEQQSQEEQTEQTTQPPLPWENPELDECSVCRKGCVQTEFMCRIRQCGIKNAKTIDCKNLCSDDPNVAACLGRCYPKCPIQIEY